MITAIPTKYHGITFRSKLEANWAATLDYLGIAWLYEPQTYVLSNGVCYLPDFFLPASRAWMEVKGEHNQRISSVEQFAADLWAGTPVPGYYISECPPWDDGGSDLWVEGVKDWYATAFLVAPLVLLARDDDPRGRLDVVGVRGPDKRYPVGLFSCDDCLHTAFQPTFNLSDGSVGPLWCRVCGSNKGLQEYHESEFDYMPFGLVRADDECDPWWKRIPKPPIPPLHISVCSVVWGHSMECSCAWWWECGADLPSTLDAWLPEPSTRHTGDPQ